MNTSCKTSRVTCTENAPGRLPLRLRTLRFLLTVVLAISGSGSVPAIAQLGVDEQHSIRWHSEEQIGKQHRVPGAAPVTVSSDDAYLQERLLPLDEAIRIALQHSEVIRVLAGTSATVSGQTIYDTAIATTPIDQAVARFDPVFKANATWRKTETPGPEPVLDPFAARIIGEQLGGNDLDATLEKTNRYGGVGAFGFRNNWNYGIRGRGLLNPHHTPGLDLSYTQPLLAGAGRAANEAPIVIARLEQDQSYFRFKGGMQDLVEGTISAYWSLVGARTELWAREIQVEQAEGAFRREETRLKIGIVDRGVVAQTRLAYANFRANLVGAKGSVIQAEAALRNLLGLPPEDGVRLVPSTPPTRDRVEFDWTELVETAQQRRPDLIELNLILHADRQRLIQANNQALPTLNAMAVQNWNGLSGRMLNGRTISSDMNDNPSWSLGINFEVPLGLRDARVNARSQELVIARDQANIQQGLHATEHTLATTVRNTDQFYEQYEAFRETRAAARNNLEQQLAAQRIGRVIFLNVLQGITNWGDAVASEASALTQYNTTLATLEQETGTILQTHGIVFMEERFRAVGPLGKHFEPECYPRSLRPDENESRYEYSDEAAEEAFDLEDFPKTGTENKGRQKGKEDESQTNSGATKPKLFRNISLRKLFRRN